MKLWTWQSPDFSLTEGHVIPERSDYFQTVLGIPKAYRRLWKRFGTDQIIWCYTNADAHYKSPIVETEWSLDVPDAQVLAFVDDLVWNRILGIKCALPRPLCRDWTEEQVAAFWARKAPPGGWWNCLFVNHGKGDSTSALIRHPIPQEWVISCLTSSRSI
jgi:hypothetical protein